ncbi:phytanoyl-CoA dioxygenase family protein [Mucilaginibacter pallidiroseus]|uniref:Phytanoyl-CoA dioxygenase family protein n=1 Tax=Mucilaginibacter pallidiroseus TaxID=2599295 RepID=A0A563UJU3_9SPHI|nr:phytanoyl-CoA dioxygenase family protein [Mucilaginibacter pallidiroseus]TWR31593.1 phytanoyl-CoA dioxygenase family protein [Mucilaginibacter pallidiroseus]
MFKVNVNHGHDIAAKGFAVINNVFTANQISEIEKAIKETDCSKSTFRKTDDLFAIRQFLKEVPTACKSIFSSKFTQLIEAIFGSGYFVVKSIYFDKPPQSNWFVAWHQDLTISVAKRKNVAGYGPWTVKQNQFAVQPPLNILKDNFTIRIHLDDADEGNGALKVLPGSHLKSVYRPDSIDWSVESEMICPVMAGGIMIMRPLLMHASNRTVNSKPRKVIHIEFSRIELDGGLTWSEQMEMRNFAGS